jgi:hypothetical protein
MGFTRTGTEAAQCVRAKFSNQKKAAPHMVEARQNKNQVAIWRTDLLGVAAAQHLGEGLDLLLPTTPLTGLLVVTFCASAFNDILAIELLLHPTQRAVDGLVLANFDFDGHLNRRGRTDGERKSRLIGQAAARPSMAFFHGSPGVQN